jgi:hypothetical protein
MLYNFWNAILSLPGPNGRKSGRAVFRRKKVWIKRCDTYHTFWGVTQSFVVCGKSPVAM